MNVDETGLPPVLMVAGLWNSGPQHWQTHWEQRHPDWQRVQQADWTTPVCKDWVDALELAIRACKAPPILVAHSLGCALVGHWAASSPRGRVAGALLVAPSDVDAPSYPDCTQGFTPMPMAALPFPSRVVASTEDEYVTQARASQFARAWGSELTWLDNAGHINGASGYGPWPEGEALLLSFASNISSSS
ncbi:RBBP9/YdeN family alpha/beta hydrolase [Leeia oryzae]|uniref:RBBP9/YdeN family alpha/beta hydrolase n=1 Tax=Leeia oryzae TaxID=356662 RepID=UPI00037BCBF5|nr:alpha/beta hydrolase [Leeia oryzae]